MPHPWPRNRSGSVINNPIRIPWDGKEHFSNEEGCYESQASNLENSNYI